MNPADAGPRLENPKSLPLPPQAEAILGRMFAAYGRVVIHREFGGGFSGSRVFLVRPIRHDDAPELPAVVKMAPRSLIEQEWWAFRECIRDRLPGVAEVRGEPVLPEESGWGGLRYPLLGGGTFEIESLAGYVRRATPEDIRFVLEERLFKSLGACWFLSQTRPEFPLRASYDRLLPVNLIVEPVSPAGAAPPVLVTPGGAAAAAVRPGAVVRLEGFAVTEVEPERRAVTLDAPGQAGGAPGGFRLRLQPVADLEPDRVNRIGEPVVGRVVATRALLLERAARQALGPEIDLGGETVRRPDGAALPNPLAALPGILNQSRDVKIACLHGDLNLENILVDPATREVRLIDFAAARRDHVLHDLLRLETGVVTRLLPEALAGAGLPAGAICALYEQAACAAPPWPDPAHPALEKPWTMLLAIRQVARACLLKPDDWSEFYDGLTVYLLSALKYKDLDELPTASLSKQVAFWGAAAAQQLAHRRPPCPDGEPLPRAAARAAGRRWPVRAAVATAALLLFVALALGLLAWQGRRPPAAAPPAATVVGLTPQVEVKRAGSSSLSPVTFGMALRPGDVVNTYAGARVSIICENGLLFSLPPESNLTVDCQDETDARIVGRLDPTLSGQLLAVPGAAPVAATGPQTRAPRAERERLPRLISPRNTWLAELRPTFHWQPAPGAEGYRLSVSLPGGESWSRDVQGGGASLAYPLDAPPLEPGSANVVTLAALNDDSAIDKSLLQVLAGADLAALRQAEAEIVALDGALDEAGRGYLLAQLYRERGLRAAAIEQLEQLAAGQGGAGPHLWQQLGDLYLEVGLPARAEDRYEAALMAAESAADPGAQARANLGLARAAQAFDEFERAISYLTAAEALFRESGEGARAEAVAAERVELEQGR